MAKQLEFSGVHFDPNAIGRIVGELRRQQDAKKDFVYPTKALAFDDSGSLVMKSVERAFAADGRIYFDWAEAERAADAASSVGRESKVEIVRDLPAIPLSQTAASQLAQRLDVPGKFVRSLQERGYRDLQATLFSELLARDDRKFLIRTLDGRARAVLSDSYRVLDNADLFFKSWETFKEVGAQAWKARLWDDGFELFATAPNIAGEVTLDRTFDPGDGWHSRWAGQSGDVHNPALRISNSETGRGGLNVNIAILRKVCANFCVWQEGVAAIHLGKRSDAEGLIASDKTKELESLTIWSKIDDCVRTAFDAERFQSYIDKLNGATRDVIEEPRVAVDNVVKAFGIAESTKDDILAELLQSGDRSRFGLVQAITATAHKLDAAGEANGGGSSLEEAGAKLVDVSSTKFAALCEV